ncbi:MAG: YggT family protein [Gammaproteobacteria bacterium]|nr:YggT family protein [Gammaproteobacteria bacterium]
MVANLDNGLIFIVGTLLQIALGLLLARVLLQLVRADFFNPISQLVWKLTQPVVRPLLALLPRWRTLDLAGGLLLYALAVIYVELLASLYGFDVPIGYALVQALLKLASLTLNLYTLSLFAQALLSWIGPGVSNPAANVLWSLNEPLLRPVRRILPPIGGIDLSPVPVMLLLQLVDRLLPLAPFFH